MIDEIGKLEQRMRAVTGSHDITVAHDVNETAVTLAALAALTGPWHLSIYFDLATLVAAVEGGTVTVRYKMKIDATTARQIGVSTFVVGTDTVFPSCEAIMGYHAFSATIQCSTAVSAPRAIPYVYVLRTP